MGLAEVWCQGPKISSDRDVYLSEDLCRRICIKPLYELQYSAYNHLIIKMISCCPLPEFLGINKSFLISYHVHGKRKVYVGIVIFPAP